jgi:hypothetical protein
MLLHGAQMIAPRYDANLIAGMREPSRDVAADTTCSEDRNTQRGTPTLTC